MGHQFSTAPGRPLLHRFLSLSQTSVGNGSQAGMISLLFCPFLLFDRAAGFLSPRPQNAEAGARRCCPGWPGSGPPEGLGLDSIEHDGTLVMAGPPQAGWDTGSEIFLASKLRP
jgi:hypothetical protein